MKSLDFGSYALCSCAVAAMLAGCGGSQPPIGSLNNDPVWTQARTTAIAKTTVAPRSKSGGYKVTAPLLYITNVTQADNDVKIYRAEAKDPGPLAVITDKISTPNGDCIDSKGTLYVTNGPASGTGWISEYALGKTVASKVVTEGVNTPAFCAIDANGNLWVTNLGLNDVAEYLPGASKPHITITKDVYYPLGIAIDHAANLYVVNGFGSSNRNIEVYAPGSSSPSRTITDGITWPDGIAVDSNGTLYVTNIATENV
jgi:sugar lactone lactonase YvrE